MGQINNKLMVLLFKILPLVAVVFLSFIIVWSQINFNRETKINRLRHFNQIFLPPADLVEDFSFGFRNFLSDIFWIQSVQYLIIEGLQKNSFMAKYLDIVTILDPHFEYPYLFANLVLPRYGTIEEARSITDRGIAANPQSWKIPFYMGVQYRVFRRDYEQALKYMKIAAERENKPQVVDVLMASYTLKSGDQVSAKELFQAIYETSDNKFVKDSADAWIKQINHIALLQDLIFGYKRLYGTYPKTVDDIVTKRLIKEIPKDLANFRFIIDQNNGILRIE